MESFNQQEKINSSDIEKVAGGWIDRARKITYSTAFVMSLVNAESALGAEIPPESSLAEGISILQEASETEDFETAATFIRLPDGSTFWFSNEVDRQSVDLFEAHQEDGDIAIYSFIKEIVEARSVEMGETLVINHYHNHPMQSLISGYTGENFSIPPSGQGFLTEGDTGFEKADFFQSSIDKVEQEYGVSVEYNKHVVDTIGTWSWSYTDKSNLQDDSIYLTRQRSYELNIAAATQDAPDTFDERLMLLEVIDAARAQFGTAYDNWLDGSNDIESPELQTLLQEYQKVGIEMRFEAHDNNE
jgi:hypothetical protein